MSDTIPEVRVERVDTNGNSSRIDVRARVRNQSSDRVEVIEYEVLGKRQGVSHHLDAGQTVDMMVYQGVPPMDDNQRRMYLRFKRLGDGRIFRVDHEVRYDCRTDNNGNRWYEPSHMDIQGRAYPN